MEQFKAVPKKWGNSLGVTIPSEVIKSENLKTNEEAIFLVMKDNRNNIKKMFGTLKIKKPTQQIMDEIDEGYDEH
ncbi:MAG TPA: AbrB/MazE/SpoVT family DNA-binding domain-containing protein [Candidatus Nanoarchaeia archaeon]|nr:AbrB/MazE/SpoVT family DNA-binding domain-containing protein [Candidatus Nanoarchaeia archaeon]